MAALIFFCSGDNSGGGTGGGFGIVGSGGGFGRVSMTTACVAFAWSLQDKLRLGPGADRARSRGQQRCRRPARHDRYRGQDAQHQPAPARAGHGGTRRRPSRAGEGGAGLRSATTRTTGGRA